MMLIEEYQKKPLGEYINVYKAKPKAAKGVITSFLCYLIENKHIDGVVSTQKSKGKVIIAKTKEEIIASAGNVWHIVPYTIELKEAIENEGMHNLAIVGLPCQMKFLRQVKTFPLVESNFGERLRYLISLFCYGTFDQESMFNLLREKYNLLPNQITEIKTTDKFLKVIATEDNIIDIPLSDVQGYLRSGCYLCPDYTGVFSDLSAGFVNKEKVLIVRTEEINERIQEAEKTGYLILQEASKKEIKEIEKKALQKIERAIEHQNRI